MNAARRKKIQVDDSCFVGQAPRLPRQGLGVVKGSRSGRPTMKEAGFSLIEVTISIAITAVALVSLMGMLPAGMKTMREAADRAVETRIHQQILSEIQLADWDARFNFNFQTGGNAALRFYDDQGIEVRPNDSNFSRIHIYTARINVPKAKQKLPKSIGEAVYEGVFIPGASNADSNLQLVIVEITSVIDDVFKDGSGFDSDTFLKSTRTFQSTITKMGKDFSAQGGGTSN